MDIQKKIRAAAAYACLSQAEIAREIGMSPQNFHSKMKRRTFSGDELEQIAHVIGAKYEAHFVFEDGTRI